MRKITVLLVGVLALAVAAYLGVSVLLYNMFASVRPYCDGQYMENTPASFSAAPFAPDFDTSPYLMPEYETIEISSREAGIRLSAWYVPGESGKPTVMVIHGLGAGTGDCKRQPRALLPAGMLHRAGYTILLIDLRNHGDSTIDGGKWAAGTQEYQDVLGAWDWLQTEKQIPAEQIGLLAYSGGTASALIAMEQEPRIPAVWLDSPFVDVARTISDTLDRDGYPRFMTAGGMLMAQVLSGHDIAAFSPAQAAASFRDQDVFIVHCDEDTTLPVDYAYEMADILGLDESRLWIATGCGHVRAVFTYPADYERELLAFFDPLSRP